MALIVAMRASALISGIVCCGANLTPSAFHHRAIHEIKKAFRKTGDPRLQLMLVEPDIDVSELSKISVPALIMAGEKDCIKEKETKRIAAGISDSRLVILQGEAHHSYVVHNASLYNEIKEFIS